MLSEVHVTECDHDSVQAPELHVFKLVAATNGMCFCKQGQSQLLCDYLHGYYQ